MKKLSHLSRQRPASDSESSESLAGCSAQALEHDYRHNRDTHLVGSGFHDGIICRSQAASCCGWRHSCCDSAIFTTYFAGMGILSAVSAAAFVDIHGPGIVAAHAGAAAAPPTLTPTVTAASPSSWKQQKV